MIVVNYHDDLNEVQGDPALAALLAAPCARAPFDRLDWWRNLQDTCGLSPHIAVVTKGLDQVVLPLMRQGTMLAPLANWYSFRLAVIASPAADAAALLTALARDLADKTRRIVLDKLGEDDARLLARCFQSAGWTAWIEPCDVNHILALNGRSFAEYLSGRPGALRSTLKRKGGKVNVSLLRTFDAQAWQDYEDVYAASWKPSEGSPAFLRRFAEEEGRAGRLRMAIARHDGRPVAAQFWTVEAGTAFIHKLAHTEDAKSLSPGTTLSAALFEQVIDRDGVDLVDFGTGNDAYKRDWMEVVRPRYRLELIRPSWPGNWPLLARRALRRLVRQG